MGHAGFLRADEILKIKVCNVKIHVDHIYVGFCSRAKKRPVPTRAHSTSDQLKQGYLSCMHQKRFWRYYLLASENKNLPLVRRIAQSKSKGYFHPCKSVSYSTIRDEFKKFLGQFVSNVDDFGLHRP